MSRRLTNWLASYVKYTHDTESNELFNTWVGISTIASALMKKTWLELGRLKVYPNLYIVLVAEPGVARKSQAISYATYLINNVPKIKLAADSTTPQALIDELVNAVTYENMPSGDIFRHSSISVVSKEFDSFMSGAGVGKMIVTLTDLFDHGDSPWRNRTKSYGTESIPAPYLNILGATTPQNLSSMAVGGGLSSRIMFIFAEGKSKRVTYPTWDDELIGLQDDLARDLHEIANDMLGKFEFDCMASNYWDVWYTGFDETAGNRIQKSPEFDGWYSRKPLLIQKVAMVVSASRSNSLVITCEDLEEAIRLVEGAEKVMHGALIKKCYDVVDEGTRQSDMLLKLITKEGMIKEDYLLHLVWRSMSEDAFEESISYLLRNNKIEQILENQGKVGVWYKAKEV